jgi:hypothetical protein
MISKSVDLHRFAADVATFKYRVMSHNKEGAEDRRPLNAHRCTKLLTKHMLHGRERSKEAFVRVAIGSMDGG